MIVITKLDYVETDRDIFYITRADLHPPIISLLGEATPAKTVEQEMIKGRRFVRVNRGERKEIVVGMSKQVQDALGMQFEVWEEMDNYASSCGSRMRKMQREIFKVKGATLWQRIKWVFTGVKYGDEE